MNLIRNSVGVDIVVCKEHGHSIIQCRYMLHKGIPCYHTRIHIHTNVKQTSLFFLSKCSEEVFLIYSNYVFMQSYFSF